jgi:CheY-like chemotaxis protein
MAMTLRILTADVLERNGYTVLQASDGAEAITMSKKFGQIDLLMTEVVMPGISLKELASSLRACLPVFKLLFTSGYTSDAISERGVIETEVTLLEKPFARNDLLNKVRIALNGL